MRDVVIVSGAEDVELLELLPFIQQGETYFIGVDRGSFRLMSHGFPLDVAVGDFDSLTKSEFEVVNEYAKVVHRSIPEKDDTDTQLALLEATMRFPEADYWLVGATGGRLDHFLANLYLPLEKRFSKFVRQIHMVDSQNIVDYYFPGDYQVQKVAEMKYLAYVCLTPVQGLELTGAKYDLPKIDVATPISYASNEFVTQEVRFSFETGVVAVIQSKDK